MKTIKFLISLLTVSQFSLAQIPNASFESWTNVGTYEDPDNWGTLNSVISTMSVTTVSKGTGGVPGGGSYFLKLVTKTVTGFGDMPGYAASGTLNLSNMSAGGFAFSQRPQNFTGSWQVMPYGSDACFISIFLSKWNSGLNQRDTITYDFNSITGMVMSWTNFTIPLTYYSGAFPDTARIILSSSGGTPVPGSYLYLDKLSFTGSVANIAEDNFTHTITTYPNPAQNILSVYSAKTDLTSCEIDIIDISGKQCGGSKISSGSKKADIDISGLALGFYIIKVRIEGKTFYKKFIKN